ncbi:unnamed protein product [Colias eurytheme]|nr:unnamed protein product [Colias eurytheme]
MMTVTKLLFCLLAIIYVRATSLENIPFETAKVVYHKQRLCIFRPGKPKCYGSEKIPGDPYEVAELFTVQKKLYAQIGNLDEDEE